MGRCTGFLRGASLGVLMSAALVSVAAESEDVSRPAAAGEARTTQPMVYESIVVTAERRSQSIQKVPAAISAFGEDKIQDARLETMQDLQRQTPSLTYSELNGNYQVSLRGLGNEFAHPSGESGVVTNVDGVYYARSTGLDSAFNDLARIEVLRGPQGTLYGRNATGGVLNLITRVPGEEFQGNVGVTYGSRDRIQVVGGVEGRILDDTNARLSFFHEDRDGDQRSIVDGRSINAMDAIGVRGTVVTRISPALEVTFRGDYYDGEIRRPYGDNVAEFPSGSPFGVDRKSVV